MKYPKMLYVLHKFCQNRTKRYYFLQDWKKAKKRPNGQIILFLVNWFKKGQMATLINVCFYIIKGHSNKLWHLRVGNKSVTKISDKFWRAEKVLRIITPNYGPELINKLIIDCFILYFVPSINHLDHPLYLS